jgi:hypothetical protein
MQAMATPETPSPAKQAANNAAHNRLGVSYAMIRVVLHAPVGR